MDAFISLCFEKGYNVEKYGLLGKTGGEQEKRVEIEVIREKRVEIPVEVIKEVEKIVEIIKEIPVEKVVIQEVIKEVPVEKIVTIYDNSNENELLLKIQQLENKPPQIVEVEKIVEIEKIVEVEKPVVDEKQKQLQQTLQTLRGQLNLKDQEINKLKEDIEYLKGEIDKPATFLRSSNLKDNI